jgi:hypothetical protein
MTIMLRQSLKTSPPLTDGEPELRRQVVAVVDPAMTLGR